MPDDEIGFAWNSRKLGFVCQITDKKKVIKNEKGIKNKIFKKFL